MDCISRSFLEESIWFIGKTRISKMAAIVVVPYWVNCHKSSFQKLLSSDCKSIFVTCKDFRDSKCILGLSGVKCQQFLGTCFSCCQAVLSVALTGCRLCPSDADTTFRLKETLRIPLKFPYLPAPGTYSHPCLRCASLARPCASVAGCCRNSKRL